VLLSAFLVCVVALADGRAVVGLGDAVTEPHADPVHNPSSSSDVGRGDAERIARERFAPWDAG
jgi:hypothetical protein